VAFFTANLNEFRVSFDDCSSPAKHLWEDKTNATESAQTLDPIGFVDHQTGRVFQSQLAGASSIMSFSDDDGQTWAAIAGLRTARLAPITRRSAVGHITMAPYRRRLLIRFTQTRSIMRRRT
jgi:hypothetical protein